MTLIDAWQYIQDGGMLAALIFALEGGRRGWYVWHTYYQDMKTDRDFWREKALKALETAGRSLVVAEKLTDEKKDK